MARRGFLAAAGAVAAAGGVSRAAELATGSPARQVALGDAGFTSSRQEGGKTAMAGTFTPTAAQVTIDIDLSCTFAGWGGGYFDFHLGVLPAPPPAPWEPGGKNRIVTADNSSRRPLPGVTEYRHFPIGIANANTIAARLGRTLVIDGLTPGRVYQWELRGGGLSFFKQYVFEPGARPNRLAVTPDNLYAWVACEGNRRLSLLQLGWAELWPLFGYSQEMLCVAELQLDGRPGGMALPRKGPYLATVDSTHNTLVIVDTDLPAVVGSYAPPPGAVLSDKAVLWSADGAKVYAGGWNDGKLHRFDLARRAFDAATVIDPDPNAALIPLTLSADGGALFCSSFYNRRLYRIDLTPAEPAATIVHTTPVGTFAPTCAAVRRRDGSLVFPDLAHNVMRHVSADGRLLNTWSITVNGQGAQHAHASVQLDADEVRAFWTCDGVVGWAWIDSARVINATHGFFPDVPYGDVALTGNEGTLLALPDSGKVVQWPGGTISIRPSRDDPGVYGAEHAILTFTSAEASHE